MADWIVVGASPLAHVAYRHAQRLSSQHTVIATNGGILVEPAPDYYVLADYIALDRFGVLARAAQQDHKTFIIIVPTRNLREKMRAAIDLIRASNPAHAAATEAHAEQIIGAGTIAVAPPVDWADETLDLADYESFQLSGFVCAEYAAKEASRVFMVGMDGYIDGAGAEGGGEANYIDGLPDGPYRRGHSQNVIPYKVDALCRKYPDVEWVHVGRPNWTPLAEYPNLRFEVVA